MKKLDGNLIPDWVLQPSGNSVLWELMSRSVELAFERMNLSARGYHRVIKVARSIADLAGEETIREPHLLEALGYRSAYQKFWE